MTTRSRVTRLASSFLVLAALVGLPLVAASGANAAPVPYSDPYAKGSLTLCDKAGHPVTSGRIDAQPFVWTAVSTTAAPKGYDTKAGKAVLMAYQPRKEHDPSEWNGEQLGGTATFSNKQHPMSAMTVGDSPLMWFTQSYPPSWDGVVQLRMYFGAPNQSIYNSSYPTADIKVSGENWTLLRGGGVACDVGTAVPAETVQLSEEQIQRHVIQSTPTAPDPAATKPGSETLAATPPAAGATAAAPAPVAGSTAAAGASDESSGSSGSGGAWGLVLIAVAVVAGGGYYWWRRGAHA